MARPKNISTLKGKAVEFVVSSKSYIILRFKGGGELQVPADQCFDRNGERYVDNAPFIGRL